MRNPDSIARTPDGQFDFSASHPEPTGTLVRRAAAGDVEYDEPDVPVGPFPDLAPPQIDEQWARLYTEESHCRSRIRAAQDRLKPKRIPLRDWQAADAQADIAKFQAELLLIQEKMTPYDDEWAARDGWTRGWYVPGGHIHRSRHCSTLRSSTQIGLVTELSGMSEDEIVSAAGEAGCTTCYPSAPAEVLNRPPTVQLPDRVEAERLRAERAAARMAKDAKAATNTLSWGDQDPIFDNGSPILKVTDARAALQSSIFYGLRRNHFPLNISDAGREVIEATYVLNSYTSDQADRDRMESTIEKDWQHAQKVIGLHRALVEKKVELGDNEEDATKALNKSLVSSMKKTYGVTPNVELLNEQQIGERQAWAAGVLHNRELSRQVIDRVRQDAAEAAQTS